MKRMHRIKPALFTFLFLIASMASNAQQPNAIDSLKNKINLYGTKNQSPVLFIHFDKNVYSTSEQVWFTAYLINSSNIQSYKTLSLALINNDSRAVVLENKFLIKNGFSFGNTTIPDSIPAGNYTFTAITNRLINDNPEVIFKQPVIIKNANQPTFTISLNPLDTSITAVQKKIMLLVNFIGGTPVSVAAHYYLGSILHPALNGDVKTVNGQYIFEIPSTLLDPVNNILHVQVKIKNEEKDADITLPIPYSSPLVRFYPEGGNLVNNIQSAIGWEVKNAAGNPISVSGFLYENNKVIDTIETNTYGLGKFNLTPKAGSNYTVKLYNSKQDTLYRLPAALTRGPVLSLANALVNDTLVVNIYNAQQEKLYLIGHNYKQLFFTQTVNMTTGIKRLKLVISALPKGLTELTLTDSLVRPFAERLFFAHYDQREPVNIITEKKEYTTRQKVNVKIKLDANIPDSGLVSVACVQENRIDLNKANDIESYFYLKNDLGSLPTRDSYLANSESNKRFLENILLIKGWSRYKWTDMLKVQPADTIRNISDMVFSGHVAMFNKPLSNPVTIINKEHPLRTITTGEHGDFILEDEDMLSEPDKKMTLLIPVNNRVPPYISPFEIYVTDPYIKKNLKLAAQLTPEEYNPANRDRSQYILSSQNEHAINLKEVNIKDKNDDTFYGNDGVMKNPPTLRKYFTYIGPGGRLIGVSDPKGELFDGAVIDTQYGKKVIDAHKMIIVSLEKKNPVQLDGIYKAKEFYVPDESQINTSGTQYLSTLYWKHQLKVTSNKEAEISFYTGDITGRFKIVAQGITGGDVTYGEATFNVSKLNQ